jgi:uncharacterized OsmC-like protein
MNERIASCMQQAISYLGEHPDEARYTDSPATATREGSLSFKVETPTGGSIVTDMPSGVGGDGSAPSPGWVMRAALAACDATLIAMRAAQEGVELEKLEVTVDSTSDDRGLLGMDDSIPAGPLRTRIRVGLSSPGTTEEQLRELVDWAHHHSPVGDAVSREIPLDIEVTAL